MSNNSSSSTTIFYQATLWKRGNQGTDNLGLDIILNLFLRSHSFLEWELTNQQKWFYQ